MRHEEFDVVIIGGGPAGLAAALEAKGIHLKKGTGRPVNDTPVSAQQNDVSVLLLERDTHLGGILQQCIHDGFGLHQFGERLSGCEYAQRYIDLVEQTDVKVLLHTMVLELTATKTIYAVNCAEGMLEICAKSVILAMGCRERTAGQVFICGQRPAGVMTAGTLQRYINMEGYLPGREAVILGSGDIGLIMARRMTIEGIRVKGVYEAAPNPGGLTRNIVQCLDDFGIPMYTSRTVTRIHGKQHIKGVTVSQVDTSFRPVPGTEEYISCDMLALAVGLIPENELSKMANIELEPKTRGPVVDNYFMTSIPGIFAAGNVSVVFDLVDYVSDSGVIAAQGAVKYIKGELGSDAEYIPVKPGNNVNFVVPQRIRREDHDTTRFFLRIKSPMKPAVLTCMQDDLLLKRQKLIRGMPAEMLSFQADTVGTGAVCVGVEQPAEIRNNPQPEES